MLLVKNKRPRIVRVVHKTIVEPESFPVQTPPAPVHHWWEDEQEFVKEVPWAQSLEYLKLELKLKRFGQHTSFVYQSASTDW